MDNLSLLNQDPVKLFNQKFLQTESVLPLEKIKKRIFDELDFFATLKPEEEFQPIESFRLRNITRSLKDLPNTSYCVSGAFGYQATAKLTRWLGGITFDHKYAGELACHLKELAEACVILQNIEGSCSEELISHMEGCNKGLANSNLIKSLSGDSSLSEQIQGLKNIKDKIITLVKTNPALSQANSPLNKEDENVFLKNCSAVIGYPEISSNSRASLSVINGELFRADTLAYGMVNKIRDQGHSGIISALKKLITNSEKRFTITFNSISSPSSNLSDIESSSEQSSRLRRLKDCLELEKGVLGGLHNIIDAYKGYNDFDELKNELSEMQEKISLHEGQYSKALELVKSGTSKYEEDLSQSLLFPTKSGDPASSLTAYCKSYCSDHLNSTQANDLIKNGEVLVKNIMKGLVDKPSENFLEAELQLTQISWFLMSCALKKGQGYEEGTFVLEDPEQRLYNFLLKNPSKHSRQSTHFTGRSSPQHYGVNIFNNLMPAEKRTLLFALVENMPSLGAGEKILFIKPENFSADMGVIKNPQLIGEFAGHTKEYILSKGNKLLFTGSDDLETMRKERVPVDVLNAFLELNEKISQHPEFAQRVSAAVASLGKRDLSVKENSKLWGISYMISYVTAIKKLEKQPEGLNYEAFDKSVSSFDHSELRTGREVILSVKEFCGALRQ